jgi:hypothetical protein
VTSKTKEKNNVARIKIKAISRLTLNYNLCICLISNGHHILGLRTSEGEVLERGLEGFLEGETF